MFVSYPRVRGLSPPRSDRLASGVFRAKGSQPAPGFGLTRIGATICRSRVGWSSQSAPVPWWEACRGCARAELPRWHPASAPRQGRTAVGHHRSRCGSNLRSHTPGIADVRSGKIRDADVVPYLCQITGPAGHTCGHHRSGRRLRPASGLIQRICHVVYRPLELCVEGYTAGRSSPAARHW
jgi:hypothetical protein